MPELPEVTTTVNGINTECLGFTIASVWTDLAVNKPTRKDFYTTIKYLPYFNNFKKSVVDAKIVSATRRGKNILINLSNNKTILVHMKMTGHMMVGKYEYHKSRNTWTPDGKIKGSPLHDPYNRFIHLVFTLKNKNQTKHFVLCDSRKFAKVALLENNEDHHKNLGAHGVEPLNPDIKYPDFEKALGMAPANNRPIKILLMDPRVIAGIGNIYTDEMLFNAGIHPESKWNKIPDTFKKALHKQMILVLKRGIDFGGDSMSDYRNIYGERGNFQNAHNAYRKTGEKCNQRNCKGKIVRMVITGRSSHFCDTHQKLYG